MGPGPGLTSANGVTGVRGRVRSEVLVGPPCRRLLRQRLCNPAAVSCVLWRAPVSPLTHSVSDSRNSQPRTRGHRAMSDRARRGEGPVPRVTVTGAGLSSHERMVVRAESCANSQNITV